MQGAEEIAHGIYQEAGCDPAEPPGPVALALALGIAVTATPGARGARWCGRRGEILVSPRLSGPALAWSVGHELGERALAAAGYGEPDREQVADAVAAALVAPRPAFRSALAAFGATPDALSSLAHAFGITQSIAALRIGEVTGRPLALVTPRRVHVRGDAYVWPCEKTVRRVAAGHDPAPVARWPLSDARRRTLLLAE